MSELVGVYAASHGPLIVRNWDVLPAATQATLTSAFGELGRRIDAARPDVLIVISPDHWVNFFIDNLPAFCVGVGETHQGPPEPWLAGFPYKDIAGHAPFAQHLLQQAFVDGFEPSVSYRLRLDHGFCVPLWKANLQRLPAIVPLIINTVEPPLPAIARCLALGHSVAAAIRAFPGNLRVAVLATGGMSHSIGEATMGAIDEAFDRECLQHLGTGDDDALLRFLDRRIVAAGNGTAEMRNWIAAHGVAGGRGFEVIHYSPMPEIYVGCGVSAWNV